MFKKMSGVNFKLSQGLRAVQKRTRELVASQVMQHESEPVASDAGAAMSDSILAVDGGQLVCSL